ncbi:hypothetical protein R2E40_10100 [Aeromonas sp. CD]|uniref:hypothetical protein n=1 Tax=Aeromonas sp. CD TaxID=3080830 RepID=UPI00296600F0|nr:hypothetical protein [Aeromonas sp. CD]WOX54440.1 hypothetical protein R2E40_10100 [Aeromonas sp. CD]
MLEDAITKTIKSISSKVYLGYLPEAETTGIVVSTISTRTIPSLKRSDVREREAIINIKIFGAHITEAKELQHKLLRLFDSVKMNVEAPGYWYEMIIKVQNLNDMFIGQDKFSQLDISVHYYEHPIT